jgi:hypothetical protein
MNTLISRLKKIDGNIFLTTNSEKELFETALIELHNLSNNNRIIFSRGSRMHTLEDMYNEISASWQFPYYFGFNSAALVDCLSDLSWMPGESYIFVIYGAHQILCQEPIEQLRGFLGDISEISRRWREDMGGLVVTRQPETDFLVILDVSSEDRLTLLSRLNQMNIKVEEILKINLTLVGEGDI